MRIVNIKEKERPQTFFFGKYLFCLVTSVLFSHIEKQTDKAFMIRYENAVVNHFEYFVHARPFDVLHFLVLQAEFCEVYIFFN